MKNFCNFLMKINLVVSVIAGSILVTMGVLSIGLSCLFFKLSGFCMKHGLGFISPVWAQRYNEILARHTVGVGH